MNQAEGTNEGDRVVSKHGGWLNGVVTPFEGHVEKKGGEYVIHVVAEGNLIEMVFDSKAEEGFATVPRTKETTSLAWIGAFVE